jgi:hypothetical protein
MISRAVDGLTRAIPVAGVIASTALAAERNDPARVEAIAAMLTPGPAAFAPPAADRAAWQIARRQAPFPAIVSNATLLAQSPVPALPDDLYLDFSRTGNRDRAQAVMFTRARRLSAFTLAEACENKGRFIKPLVETIDAICSEKTWVYPAHDRKLDNFQGRTMELDLRATAVGWDLATVDHLLADRLPAPTRHAIRGNVRRRVLQPYREMVEGKRPEIHWLHATHNWNAVCLAGVTGAALALEEQPADRAWYIAAAERYIRSFLSGFTPDGYCSEGIGYWNYGYGHFLMLGELVRRATRSRVDLFADPAALQPAMFSLRSEILSGLYPSISDCHPGSRPSPQFVRFICEWLGRDAPAGVAEEDASRSAAPGLIPTLMAAFTASPLPTVPRVAAGPDSPLRAWFKDGGVLICRPLPETGPAFAAALKGGHNAEHHNHNDVGSFSVVAGRSMILCDPGGEVYTARTFSSRRYESKVLNSFGHAVPVVAGKLQREGADARAVVLRAEFQDIQDVLALDIRSAYKIPQLTKLERTFTFRRGSAAALIVGDDVEFSDPQPFETALITWGKWKRLAANELQVTDGGDSVRVKIDTGGFAFKISSETIDEDVFSKRKPVRIGIALERPVAQASVRLTIEPVPPRRGERS